MSDKVTITGVVIREAVPTSGPYHRVAQSTLFRTPASALSQPPIILPYVNSAHGCRTSRGARSIVAKPTRLERVSTAHHTDPKSPRQPHPNDRSQAPRGARASLPPRRHGHGLLLQQRGCRVALWLVVEFVEASRFLARTPGAGHKREDLAEARPIPSGAKRKPRRTRNHWSPTALN